MIPIWLDLSVPADGWALFGVSPVERLRRSLSGGLARADITLSGAAAADARWEGPVRRDPDPAPLGERLRRLLAQASGPVVVLDAAAIVDPRLLDYLAKDASGVVAERGEGARRAVVLRLSAAQADAIPAAATDLRDVADALLAAGRIQPLDERGFPAYINKLRRSLPYWIHRVDDADQRRVLERQLFWDNYKGSTDLLTRWVFPPLVWPMTRWCAKYHVHPNVITVLSIALAGVAAPLFATGHWLAGFACAYAMAVLDSVDGKVARVTMTSSDIGNVLDHGTDIVHPPFWYFAWAIGLGGMGWDDPVFDAGVALVGFYIGDRLVLAVAKAVLKRTLHGSTPLDGVVRSIIARRNILLAIMTVAVPLGLGVEGLYLCTAWQAATMAWHAWRTFWLGMGFSKASLI